MSSYDYIRDGAEIYRQSFATIRAETDLSAFGSDTAQLLVRMIHASGQTDLTSDFDCNDGAAAAARDALETGAPILCDAHMVAAGITRARLPRNNDVVCTLREPSVPDLASEIGNTRSAAALQLWGKNLGGAVVAIGNAPTALFYLLELIEQGAPMPAVIIGCPVGFIGAAESKRALADNPFGLNFITLHGRRGGSAITAAAVNALASRVE